MKSAFKNERRLLNYYSSDKIYFEKVDFIKRKEGHKIKYFLNYKCFERIAMSGNTKRSEEVRAYFTLIREFLTSNAVLIKQTIHNKYDLHQYRDFDTVYFFAVNEDEFKKIYKVGTDEDIVKRLSTYNTGRVPDVDLLFLALITNKKLFDTCIKEKLRPYSVIKNREIYYIDPKDIKKALKVCYETSVTEADHLKLIESASELNKFYDFIKDNDVKPLVVFDKTIEDKKEVKKIKVKTPKKKTNVKAQEKKIKPKTPKKLSK